MFRPTRYLTWARRFYGQVPFDLATSGMALVSREELGAPKAALDDPAGWGNLRAAIAAYNGVPRDEAVATLGTTHALWLAYATLLSPGDDVLVESPAYEPLVRIAEGVGANVVHFERAANGGYAIDPARVAAAMTPRTRVIAVTNLHNPSGVRTSDITLRELARIAESRGAYLLVDEVYAPFDALTDSAGVFHGSARKLGGNVVTTSSLTKCYGLGNERFGWMLAPADIALRAEDAITASCGMLPLSHAHLGAHAFARVASLADRARSLLGGKRERVAAWVASRPELTWSAPREGLFGLVTTSRAGDLTALIEHAAKEEGVLVAAGAFFGVPNGFRLAWSIADEKLDEALARLGRVLPTA
jgi:aspartate/methionine/tyrosine aminotransferase